MHKANQDKNQLLLVPLAITNESTNQRPAIAKWPCCILANTNTPNIPKLEFH